MMAVGYKPCNERSSERSQPFIDSAKGEGANPEKLSVKKRKRHHRSVDEGYAESPKNGMLWADTLSA
jgi:hypothetical protein